MKLDLLVLGNLIVDDIVRADGSTRMACAGGAVIYVALAARRCGLRVGVVSVAGDDYPTEMLDLLEREGVETAGIRRQDGPGLRLWLLDEGDRRQVIHRLARPSHAEMSPRLQDIPADWLDARAIHLAPMPFDVQGGLVRALRGREGLLSLDPFDLLHTADVAAWRDQLRGVDVFFVSEDEVLLDDPEATLPTLVDPGGAVVAKRGARGGRLWRDGEAIDWQAEEVDVVDPTGAGDSFAAAFLASSLAGEDLANCARSGARSARHAIANLGVAGLIGST